MAKRKPGDPPGVVLGTMNFGKRTSPQEGERIVRRALERGIRSFDTANVYNAGESERILGRALGADRDRVVVATKAGLGTVMGRPEGLSPAAMERQLAGSLERLGMLAVDVYYLHVPDRATPIEETLGTIESVMASGRAKSWGVSNYASWQILEMIHLADGRGLARPIVAQMLYNAIHRQLEVEYFAFARRYSIHTMTYNALAGGLLAGVHAFSESPAKGSRFDDNATYRRRYWTKAMFEHTGELAAVAHDEGCSLIELAYAWVAQRHDVDSLLLGPATVAQLDHALDAVSRKLTQPTLARVDELARAWTGTDTNYAR